MSRIHKPEADFRIIHLDKAEQSAIDGLRPSHDAKPEYQQAIQHPTSLDDEIVAPPKATPATPRFSRRGKIAMGMATGLSVAAAGGVPGIIEAVKNNPKGSPNTPAEALSQPSPAVELPPENGPYTVAGQTEDGRMVVFDGRNRQHNIDIDK